MLPYVDDPTIENDAALWRRICPIWFVVDKNRNSIRVSSAAFDDHPNGTPTSVILAEIYKLTGREALDALAGHEGYALASITAGFARLCAQGVARDPLPDESAHAFVFGRKTKSIKRKLATGSHWVIPPPVPIN